MKVVVVGAGMGGLVAALLLAQAGAEVTVLEAAERPGGKLHQVAVGGALIDGGPTVFTMRGVFDGIFAAVGTSLEAHVRLEKLDVLARHAWQDGSQLDLFAEPARNVDAVAAFAGGAAARGYADFARRARQIFELLDHSFMRVPQPGLFGLMRRAGPGVASISPFDSLMDELGKYFSDQRLRQLFGRYATYCGSSPYEAPATLMLIAHAEAMGVWAIEGGMYALAKVFCELAQARGAKFVFGARVKNVLVSGGKVAGVATEAENFAADAVVANADFSSIDAGYLGPEAQRALFGMMKGAKKSLSAVTWAMTGTAEGFPLAHHNVFFAPDYKAEFDELRGGKVPERPTVYVCAPQGKGEFFCLVNAPANGAAVDETVTANMLSQLQRCGLRLQAGAVVRTDPAAWEQRFAGTGGALYGRALAGWKDSFARPGAKTKLPGFYLAGGGVHPGPGLPMAATSGRIAAQCVLTRR